MPRCPEGECVAGAGPTCLAIRTGHWKFCEQCKPGHPSYDARFVPMMRDGLPPAPVAPDAQTTPAFPAAPAWVGCCGQTPPSEFFGA